MGPKTIKFSPRENIDPMYNGSPTLLKDLKRLKDRGWRIVYEEESMGNRSNHSEKIIYIDKNRAIQSSLIHEVGHAIKPPDFILNTPSCLENLLNYKGEAVMYNMKIRAEIKNSTDKDIGINGFTFPFLVRTVEDIYLEYTKGLLTHKEDVEKIGQLMGNRDAGNTGKSYRTLYGEMCKQ